MGKDKKAYVELKLIAKEKGNLSVEDELKQADPEGKEAEKALQQATSSVIEGVK